MSSTWIASWDCGKSERSPGESEIRGSGNGTTAMSVGDAEIKGGNERILEYNNLEHQQVTVTSYIYCYLFAQRMQLECHMDEPVTLPCEGRYGPAHGGGIEGPDGGSYGSEASVVEGDPPGA
jgi:hypothetical protein